MLSALSRLRRKPPTAGVAVTVDEVVDTGAPGAPPKAQPAPCDGHVEVPVPGDELPGFALRISGWAVGLAAPVEAIEVWLGDERLSRVGVDRPRPDVRADFPHALGTDSGFETVLGVAAMPRSFELDVKAVLDDGRRVALSRVGGRRGPLLEAPRPQIRPVILRMLGRSGSTWLMRLLDHHPEVIVYRPFEFEPRIAGYWLQVLHHLSEPRGWLGALVPTGLANRRWWLDQPDGKVPPPQEASLGQALGGDAIRELAELCRRRIEAPYLALAHDGKGGVCFAEKGWGHRVVDRPLSRLWRELYPQAREVVLIRDPRDRICSLDAYNAKRGISEFGRERGRSDEYFLRDIREMGLELLREHRIAGERSLLIRYEELVDDPGEVLSQVCGHIGVDASPDTLTDVLERASQETPAMTLHRTGGDAEATVGRWRRDMTPALQSSAADILGDLLVAYGYESA